MLLSSKRQGRKYFWKLSKPCNVGTHWIALDEYSQVSTQLPGFQSFFRFLHHFVLAKLATCSVRYSLRVTLQWNKIAQDTTKSNKRVLLPLPNIAERESWDFPWNIKGILCYSELCLIIASLPCRKGFLFDKPILGYSTIHLQLLAGQDSIIFSSKKNTAKA